MSLQSKTLRDLIASVTVTGLTSSLNVEQNTTTDLIRACIAENPISTPWTATTISYEISGYTVAADYPDPMTPTAVYTAFYVNTGATLETLGGGVTGDTVLYTYLAAGQDPDLIPSGITVSTISTTTYGTTVTDNNSLRVNLGGGSGTVTFPGDVQVIGDLYVSGNTYEQDQYVTDELIIGTAGAQGSWRFIHDTMSDNLLIQMYTGVTWVTKLSDRVS